MPRKQHQVSLTLAQRTELLGLLRRGAVPALTQTRARVLLKAAEGWSDARVAEAVNCSVRTVARIRAAWVDQGLACLQRHPRVRNTPPKLSSEQTSQLPAVATTNPPQGQARWTLRLLAQRAVELELVDRLSYETVRRTLKKTRSSPGRPSAL